MKKIGFLLFVAVIVLGCASTAGSFAGGTGGSNTSAGTNDNVTSSAGNSVISSTENNVSSGLSNVSSGGGNTNTVNYSSIIDVEWNLTEVYIDGRNTQFRRTDQPSVNINLFTLTFDNENISGVGAPNRYSAPYTMSEDGTVNISLVRSTLMAALFEPVNLKAHDFFNYVQKANKWSLVNGNLELQSLTENNLPVRMVFSK